MFQGVGDGPGEVTKDLPQLPDGEDPDIEDDKQANKLDRDGPAQHGPKGAEPLPPDLAEWLTSYILEASHGKN